jgi:tetratricopeptide (TPR) repeat protein
MKGFYEYLEHNKFDTLTNRVAHLMAEKGVDPYAFIAQYLDKLDAEAPINEFLGGFIRKLGAAWKAFWKTPSVDDPSNRLETAKEALNDLIAMLKQSAGAERGSIEVVIRGLEQSLQLIARVEPTIKQYNQKMMAYRKGDASAALPDIAQQLPDDLNKRFVELMTAHNQLMDMPDSEDKLNKLQLNQDQIEAFYKQLSDVYQKINPADEAQKEYKTRIKNFLMKIENDTAFQQIQNLMNFAKQRSGEQNLAVSRPDQYHDVVFAWRNIASKTRDPNQQKQQLLQWYQTLDKNHPVKAFITKEMQEQPGHNEADLFWNYANDWINKFTHHLGEK